jgi:hypothetical protein
VENTREYQDETDASRRTALKHEAFDKWMAFLLICNSDQSKHDSLLNGLVSQFSMDNNQYPKIVTAATDIMSNHRHDHRGNQGNQQTKRNWNNSMKESDDETSSTTTGSETSFTQISKDQTCYCC